MPFSRSVRQVQRHGGDSQQQQRCGQALLLSALLCISMHWGGKLPAVCVLPLLSHHTWSTTSCLRAPCARALQIRAP